MTPGRRTLPTTEPTTEDEDASGGRRRDEIRMAPLLRPAILVLLQEGESHGYDLTTRLAEVKVDSFKGGSLYRALREMAEDGLLSSQWDTPERGPARRVYALTPKGETHLDELMASVGELQRATQALMKRHRRQQRADSSG